MATFGRAAAIASVSILLMAIGTGVYLSQVGATGTSTSSGTSEILTKAVSITTSSTTSSSSLGLNLSLSVNSTTIPSEDSIMISASIENTLLIANNLTATNDWAIQGLSAGPCGNFIEPIGLGILKGDYGPNNVTSAGRPLSVWAEISCPADYAFNGTSMYDLYNITSYLLPPGTESNPNYNATYAGYYMVSTPQPPPICDNGTCVYTSTPPTYAKGVFTTWMSDQATIYAAEGGMFTDSLHSSLPGNYTVVAGDEWGQIQILHFQVVPSNKLPSVGTFLTWGGCAEASNGTAYAETCEAQELSSAHVFNCASEAATTNGCSATITGVGVFPWQPSPGSSQTELPIQNNTITVWYPFTGGTAQPAGTNCYYQIAHGYPGTHYASCLMVNATAFVIGT